MAKVVMHDSTEENREFWRVVEAAEESVRRWPDWKRAGISVATERSHRYDDNSTGGTSKHDSEGRP